MNTQAREIAEKCLKGAEEGTMHFPEIVGTLMQNGFEGYTVDFRTGKGTYYLEDGSTLDLPVRHSGTPAAGFDSEAIGAAIREAQAQGPDYTYAGFCSKVLAAGCAGYMVSFSGRRAMYFGRTAETHVEHFPS